MLDVRGLPATGGLGTPASACTRARIAQRLGYLLGRARPSRAAVGQQRRLCRLLAYAEYDAKHSQFQSFKGITRGIVGDAQSGQNLLLAGWKLGNPLVFKPPFGASV